MEVSEDNVDGALEPTHSTEHEAGAVPKAGGEVHISTDLSRIASIIRLLTLAATAITTKFKRLPRVIVFVEPPVFMNLNLCFTRKVGVNCGGRTAFPERLTPRFLGFRDLLDFDLRCMS